MGPLVVAHVMGKMVGGGLEAVVMNYYRHIDRRDLQFDFLVDADSTLVPREEIESLGGRVLEVPPYQSQPANARELRRLFAEQGYRIVHAHSNTLSFIALRAARAAGVPVRIAHAHSTAGRGDSLKNLLKLALRTQSNRYPTHRLACGEYAGSWQFGNRVDFTVMKNAVELERFVFSAAKRRETRMRLGIDERAPVFGHVGRLTRQKNQTYLLDAFALVLDERPDALLLLAGSGADLERVSAHARALGISASVRFLGQCDDAAGLYSCFDVFCLPSLYEGFPVVAVEAQAANLPIVLSDRITEEVSLTGLVHRLPIDVAPRVWAESMLGMLGGDGRPSERTRPYGERLAEYDITHVAAALTSFYLRALAEVGA